MSETLHNGIVLPEEWPPQNVNLKSWEVPLTPYLAEPPAVIPISLGRQLLVDDFLVENTTLTRVFHQPVKHPGNPILFPQTAEECHPDYPPCAVAKCGGVWFDDRSKRFKMWYMAGYVGWMAYAESDDGIHWERPELDVVPGTNLCFPRDFHPDSGTVWLDHEAKDENARFKILMREPDDLARARVGVETGSASAMLMTSPDGIHWSDPTLTGMMYDRSTMFHDPFRNKWVQSIRSATAGRGRTRHYWEDSDFLASGSWTEEKGFQFSPVFREGQPLPWAASDYLDEAGDSLPQLYNLDATPYESLMLGFFQILKGPPNPVGLKTATPKLTELTLAYSRDGFHWHRPDRRAFIGANRVPGSWEYGYVEPSGGVCLIVGEELWFYYSAYGGDPARIRPNLGSGMYGNGAVGLAKLRRDGFASMRACFPDAELLTRPLTFQGGHLFVNATTTGSYLRVECLDETQTVVPGFSLQECEGFEGNSTCAEIRWKSADIAQLAGRPVQLRFVLDRGDLFSFWVSSSSDGKSGGYIAAGGPGLSGSRDQ